MQELETVVMGGENPLVGLENGVTEVTKVEREIQHAAGIKSVYVCPRKKTLANIGNVLTLPSFPMPGSNDYRIALPYEVPPELWQCLTPGTMATVLQKCQVHKVYCPCGRLVNRQLTNQLRTINPDVIQCQGDQQVGHHLAITGDKLGVGVMMQNHTNSPRYIDQNVSISEKAAIAKQLQAARSLWIAQHAALVTCPSKVAEREFREFTTYEGPIEIFPSISPVRLIDQDERAEFEKRFREELPAQIWQNPLVACCGRVTREKNWELAIHALAEYCKIERNHTQVPVLVFVGPDRDDHKKKLETIAKSLGVFEYLVFLGGKPKEFLHKILQICPIALLPSMTETQGLIGLEAQICGCIPIVLTETALAEGVYDLRLMLSDDPAEWANLMYKLINNDELRSEIAPKLRQVALRANNYETYAKKYLSYLAYVKSCRRAA